MNAITSSRAGTTSLAPQNWAEASEFAHMAAASDMVPKDFKGKPANIMLAIQWGSELGLGPLQALQGIAVINGRPSLWGDAALALVLGHPGYAGHREGVDGEGDARAGFCAVIRKGGPEHVARFSVADAKKAGLWGKAGPWQQYPDRMLVLRARGFAIRDKFADALRGVITAEEAQDIPTQPPMPPARGPLVESTAERNAAPAQDWPLLSPSGTVLEPKSEAQWLRWMKAALDKMGTDAPALGEYRRAMAPLLESIRETQGEAVDKAEAMIDSAMDAAADAGFPGDMPTHAGEVVE